MNNAIVGTQSQTEVVTEYGLLMLGPPAVGKGTQARNLAKHHGFWVYPLGDIIRGNSPHREKWDCEDLAIKARAFSDAGQLADDSIITAIDAHCLPRMTKHRKVAFDGSCRTIGQARAFVSIFDKVFGYRCRLYVSHMSFGAMPREEVEKTLMLRDKGEDRGTRSDSQQEKFLKRLAGYYDSTLEAARYLKECSRVAYLKDISALRTPQSIFGRLSAQLGLVQPAEFRQSKVAMSV